MNDVDRLGLTRAEARRLLQEVGPNALPPPERTGFFKRLLRQFQSALIYLLLFALVFDLAAWLYEGAERTPVEALAILGILVLNAVLGVLQEYRSERALDELKKLSAPHVFAYRDGALESIPAEEVVPGDALRLEAGDRVPADGIAHHAESLNLDESLLTGESVPVDKGDGDELFSGTLITRGHVVMLVKRTGASCAVGKLAGTLSSIEAGKTPLEHRINQLGRKIAIYVAILSGALIVLGLAYEGLVHFSAVVMFAVALGVAIVPEGMPAVMTLVLAFGVQRMARRKAVVRRLSAVEALGSVTVIASDKTGTLTQNRIAVDRLETEHENEALLALCLANDADHSTEAGDPLEIGLLEYARAHGSDVAALRNAHPRVSTRPFDSRWKYMRATVITPQGETRSYVKGALEVVLERCALTPEARARIQREADEAAKSGHKVLGIASGPGDTESELRFLGFVSLWDAPRPEAEAAVRAARNAGIKVAMITGDHPATARAIAERVGIRVTGILTGADLDQLSDAKLTSALSTTNVFARTLPEHKLRIVQALQANGEVVAMTGDGLNDAPALKKADIGVAMGERGSEVAREVSDVVLLDDNFATIVTAIEEGRGIYENLMSFVRFTFSSNVALMLLVLGGAVGSLFLGLRSPDGALLLPLTALQILWINFLGDGPAALALSVDRNQALLERPPRPRDTPLLDRTAVKFILLDGVSKGVAGLALLMVLPRVGLSLAETATCVFVYELAAKLVSAYPARRIATPPRPNAWLHLSVAAGLAFGVACVFWSPLRSLLELTPLGGTGLAAIAISIAVTFASGELIARLLRDSAAQVLRSRTA
jgi:Ca2+-transporting ATPase